MITAFTSTNGKVKEVSLNTKTKNFLWIDCSSPSKHAIDLLAKKLSISSEEFKSNLDSRERPRVELFDKFTLIIFRTPYLDGKTVKTFSFPIFVGKNFIITAHNKPVNAITRIRDDITNNHKNMFNSLENFLSKLLSYILADFFDVLDKTEKNIDTLDHKAMNKTDQDTLEDIFKTKKTLIYFHNALIANREVIASIERERVPQINNPRIKLFRPLYDDITQLIDMEATYRDILTGTLDIYLSSISNKLSIVMKKMTAYGSLILVPTLISGIYGMNFKYMPELQWRYGYYFALLLMIFSIVGLYTYFDRKGWL